ncbi:MmgE/PrpD family protein [Pseudarthrobacter sp. AG30]|uniref:MmgE/PrpD family protein n=1 Tax=Pseudarthrobacter sp. AG30 TaxID=2249742 RepID=UPI000D6E4F67|nr:MmgE/PrpD family protein [Pseudarthrobacter sp. AG30]RAX14927.1 MmgE/PrpD family protein [Pseudarthrobacter sp. AG30]
MDSARATASQAFAAFFTSLTLADVPTAAQHRAKLHLLDTLGAGTVGSASNEAQISRKALGHAHGRAQADKAAPVWGTPASVPPLQAAFVNGVAAHAFELDDSSGCDHSGAVVVPAALAATALASQPVPGERLILAIIAGYELGRRVESALGGYDAVNDAGWHSTGVCGTFAAAAASSLILGLNAQQMTSAIGLAGSFTGGTWAFMSDGTMSKRLHVGRAAEAGLNSAALALAGFTGPSDIFSARWGSFLALYGAQEANETELYSDLGGKWLVEEASIKPYASCRSTHSAIDALLHLKKDHKLVPDAIDEITVRTSPLIFDMCGGRDTSSLVAAQLSMPFALATALIRDSVGLKDVAIEGRSDPAIVPLMERIRIEVDSTQHGGAAEPHLEVRTNGRAYQRQASVARGAATNRLSDKETVAKFRDLAGTRLDDDAAELLVNEIRTLELCPDTRALQALLQTTSEPDLIH